MTYCEIPSDQNQLSSDELEYVADMLRAIVHFKAHIDFTSTEASQELESNLQLAESALRRAVAEMKSRCSAALLPENWIALS
jgi:hypothetical protein